MKSGRVVAPCREARQQRLQAWSSTSCRERGRRRQDSLPPYSVLIASAALHRQFLPCLPPKLSLLAPHDWLELLQCQDQAVCPRARAPARVAETSGKAREPRTLPSTNRTQPREGCSASPLIRQRPSPSLPSWPAVSSLKFPHDRADPERAPDVERTTPRSVHSTSSD